MFGEMRPFIMHYFLVDDTLEIREVHAANDGHDPFPVLVKRQKVPKDRLDVKCTSILFLTLFVFRVRCSFTVFLLAFSECF